MRLLKKKPLFFFIIAVILLVVGFVVLQIKPTRNLVILFTHDLHSNLEEYSMPAGENVVITGGFARLSGAIANELRGKENNTLVLDAGDFSMGTLFHTIRSAYSPELVAMGLMGYDATTFGNHEFEFGPNHLGEALIAAKRNSQDRLPAIIASNTVIGAQAQELADFNKAYNEYPVRPYIIIKRSGLKIGLFGLMGKDAGIYVPEAKPVTFSDSLEAARLTVKELRDKEKVDMVICLSHSGTWVNKNISEDEILAKSVPGIDIIISGHTHTILDPYIHVYNTYIVSADCYSRFLGRLEVAKNASGSFKVINYKLIPITSVLPVNPNTTALIDLFKKEIDKSYLALYNYHYGQVLAETSFSIPEPDWSKCDDRAKCYASGLGDLVADSFIYAVKKTESNNYRDIAFVLEGFGQIRVPLARGKLSVNDIFRLLALGIGPDDRAGSAIVTFWLSGSEIRDILELETTLAPNKDDLRLEIAGARFSYDPKALPFSRVRKVEMQAQGGNWQPLEEGRLYRVCSNWKTMLMRDNLAQLSGGKIAFVPKDETGQPIADIKETIVFADAEKKLELKEWLALALYLESFADTDNNGLPDVPEQYRQARINITQE